MVSADMFKKMTYNEKVKYLLSQEHTCQRCGYTYCNKHNEGPFGVFHSTDSTKNLNELGLNEIFILCSNCGWKLKERFCNCYTTRNLLTFCKG